MVLSDHEEHTLKTEVNKLDPNEEAKVMELVTSYERKGKIEGKQDAICMILETRLGSSTFTEQEKVRSIDDLQLLDELLKNILSAESLKDAHKMIERVT